MTMEYDIMVVLCWQKITKKLSLARQSLDICFQINWLQYLMASTKTENWDVFFTTIEQLIYYQIKPQHIDILKDVPLP